MVDWLKLNIVKIKNFNYTKIQSKIETLFSVNFLVKVIIVLLLFLFKNNIETLVTTYLLINLKNNSLQFLYNYYILDLICLYLTSYVLYLSCLQIKQINIHYSEHKEKYKFFFSIFDLTIITIKLFYYRRYSNLWQYVPLKIWQSIKFYDITSFAVVLSWSIVYYDYLNKWIIKILTCDPLNFSKDLSLTSDAPITKDDEDEFKRTVYAETLAKTINQYYNNSVAIFINGVWGSGKTSFLNLIKNNLNLNERSVIIKYNPYYRDKNIPIIEHFINVIKSNCNIAGDRHILKLIRYLEIINGIQYKKSLWAFDLLIKFFNSNNNNIELLKEKINKYKYKFYFFIDDIDRLDKNEIIDILMLMRETSEIPNTVFICAADTQYVLQKLNESQEYLNKYFQLIINMPQIEPGFLINYAKEKILAVAKDKYMGNFKLPDDLVELLNKALITYRDAKIFTNIFKLDYSLIKEEIELKDFILLSIIKFRYPFFIEILYYDRFSYLDESFSIKNSKVYVCKSEIEFIKNVKIRIKENNNIYDLVLLFSLISKLFPKIDSNNPLKGELYSSICFLSNFETYFTFRFMGENLSNKEFNDALKKPKEEYFKVLEDGIKKYGYPKIKLKFSEIENYPTKEYYKKIIEGLLYIARIVGTDSFDFEDLKNRTDFDKNSAKEIANNLFINKDEFIQYILSLLNHDFTIDDIIIKAKWLNVLNRPILPYGKSNWDKSQIKLKMFSYLDFICNLSESFNENILFVYNQCRSYADEITDPIYDEARDILLKFIISKFSSSFCKFYYADNYEKFASNYLILQNLYNDQKELKALFTSLNDEKKDDFQYSLATIIYKKNNKHKITKEELLGDPRIASIWNKP